ncbi:MAG: HD domain-containing protein [Nitrospiria bacterium]
MNPLLQEVSLTSREYLYEGLALMADPIHNYIPFTVPFGSTEETTEKDLIDSRWVQRLRYINQLQSARWVYPSAEHSRFVHSLGAMHVAGRFARHLYSSLKEVVPDCPSASFIEGLLRVSVLLHDVGHGPFCHFFDHNFLDEYHLTHEKLGQAIIEQELGDLIKRFRRSPLGPFKKNEQIDPKHVSFLIHKDKTYETPAHYPRWLTLLKPLFSGIFTADNLDYVLRDSFMCGVSVGPIDLNRLIHYTFFTEQGLTLHKAGLPTLTMFLNSRSYLYFNVYYHRTTRAIDLHMKEIFRSTLKEIFPYNPLEHLEGYVDLTDWSLLLEVRSWRHAQSQRKKDLFYEWDRIWKRDLKWKMAFDATFSPGNLENQNDVMDPVDLERKIRCRLPIELKDLSFRIDIASRELRPVDPLMMGERQIYVFNPSTRIVSKEGLAKYVDSVPVHMAQCRVYALNHEQDLLLSQLAMNVLSDFEVFSDSHP